MVLRGMRYFPIAAFGGGLLLSLTATAGGETAAEAPLTDQQVTAGLVKFAGLLEKDLPAEARWVKIVTQGREVGLLAQRGDGAAIGGNAFVVREKKGAELEAWMPVTAGLVSVKVARGSNEEDLQLDAMGGMGSVMQGEWQDANLAHDVEETLALMKRQADHAARAAASGTPNPFDGAQQPGITYSDDPRSVLLVSRQCALMWAAALQRTGHAEEALKVGRGALQGTTAADRQALLDQVFGFIANARWHYALSDFQKHKSWTRLRDDLNRIIQTYATGWPQHDAARVLLLKLNERAGQPAEPPLKLARPLPENDQKELRAWLKAMQDHLSTALQSWSLIPSLAEEENNFATAAPKQNPDFPQSRGVAAVAMFASLLGDDTATTVSLPNHESFYNGGRGDREDDLKQAYSQLAKPLTRADLAWMALEQVLPSQMQNEAADDRTQAVLQWYESIKNASPQDIAIQYLENGNQSPNIIANVAAIKDEKKVRRVEDALISSAQIYSLEQLEPYVRQRKTQALPFLTKLRQKCEGELTRYSGQDAQMKKMLDRSMSRLEGAAKGEEKVRGVDELLATVAKVSYNEDPFNQTPNDEQLEAADAWRDLPAALAKLPDLERFKITLKYLPDFQSPEGVGQLYMMLLDSNYTRRGGPSLAINLKPEQRKQAIAETRESWLNLLGKKFPNFLSEEQNSGFMWFTELAIEAIATGRPITDLQAQASQFLPLGSRLKELNIARAMNLLDGSEPVPWPDAKSVPDADAQKLLAELGGLEPEPLRKRLSSIPPAQVLAIHAQLVKAIDGSWPVGFVKLASLIQKVEVTGVKDEAPWRTWEGKQIDFKTVAALASQAGAHTETDVIEVSLGYNNPFDGWTLKVEGSGLKKRIWYRSQLDHIEREFMRRDNDQIAKHHARTCLGWFNANSSQGQWLWFDKPVIPAAGATPSSEPDSTEPQELQALTNQAAPTWARLRTSFDTAAKQLNPLVIRFVSASSKALDENAAAEAAKRKNGF